MNTHFIEHITKEKTEDVTHSIELFVAIAVAISLVGIVFIAAV